MVMLSLSQIVFLVHLINFFVDVGPKLASNIKHSGKHYYQCLLNPTQKGLFMKPIVADEVVKIIRDGSLIRPQLWPHNLRPATATALLLLLLL